MITARIFDNAITLFFVGIAAGAAVGLGAWVWLTHLPTGPRASEAVPVVEVRPASKIVTLYAGSGEKLLELKAASAYFYSGVYFHSSVACVTDMNGKDWELTGTIVIRPADAPMPPLSLE